MVAIDDEVTDMMHRIARCTARRAIRSHKLSNADLDDVYNLCLLAMWRQQHRHDASKGTLGGFLKVVSVRTASDYAKRMLRRTRHEVRFNLADHDHGRGEDVAGRNELPPSVLAALDKLPPHRVDALQAVYYRGESAHCYARRTGRAHQTVTTIIKRTVKALRGTLQLPQAESARAAV